MATRTGSERVVARITGEPIRLEELGRAGSSADGALVLFIGRVRDLNDGRPVARLHYEAYGEMAERELGSILNGAASRWDLGYIEAVHRSGTLEPGEPSVAIVVAAPHRAAAYEASRYVIEEIKAKLPVWKREKYLDGSETWVGAPSPEEQ